MMSPGSGGGAHAAQQRRLSLSVEDAGPGYVRAVGSVGFPACGSDAAGPSSSGCPALRHAWSVTVHSAPHLDMMFGVTNCASADIFDGSSFDGSSVTARGVVDWMLTLDRSGVVRQCYDEDIDEDEQEQWLCTDWSGLALGDKLQLCLDLGTSPYPTLSLYDEAQGWRKDVAVRLSGIAGAMAQLHPVISVANGHVTLQPEKYVPGWVDSVPSTPRTKGSRS